MNANKAQRRLFSGQYVNVCPDPLSRCAETLCSLLPSNLQVTVPCGECRERARSRHSPSLSILCQHGTSRLCGQLKSASLITDPTSRAYSLALHLEKGKTMRTKPQTKRAIESRVPLWATTVRRVCVSLYLPFSLSPGAKLCPSSVCVNVPI